MTTSFELSVVIPVFNGEHSIGEVVDRIGTTFANVPHEIILVDDGSQDGSASVCRQMVMRQSTHIRFVELARNFGEHHAVLAGLKYTSGDYVAVLDDDGQNPPEEVPRMLGELRGKRLDVVYGKQAERKDNWFRQLGSAFNDRVANVMLRKPPEIYLSSFKVMNRFVVNEILKYPGPFPYIDGLICRTSNRLGQIEVKHDLRIAGRSNYSLVRLVRLWLNMFLGFSIVPLRFASLLGLLAAMASTAWLIAIVVDKLWIDPGVTAGVPTILACISLFSGVQLIVLGMIGEYLGRVHLSTNGQPQYVVRSLSDRQV